MSLARAWDAVSTGSARARAKETLASCPYCSILGPIFGIAALAILVAHAHKGYGSAPHPTPRRSRTRSTSSSITGCRRSSCTRYSRPWSTARSPAQLEALAHELGAKYPIAASELHAKAAALRETSSEAVSPPPVAVGTPHGSPGRLGTPHERTSPTPAATSPDTGEAALILQAAMRAYAQETRSRFARRVRRVDPREVSDGRGAPPRPRARAPRRARCGGGAGFPRPRAGGRRLCRADSDELTRPPGRRAADDADDVPRASRRHTDGDRREAHPRREALA